MGANETCAQLPLEYQNFYWYFLSYWVGGWALNGATHYTYCPCGAKIG